MGRLAYQRVLNSPTDEERRGPIRRGRGARLASLSGARESRRERARVPPARGCEAQCERRRDFSAAAATEADACGAARRRSSKTLSVCSVSGSRRDAEERQGAAALLHGVDVCYYLLFAEQRRLEGLTFSLCLLFSEARCGDRTIWRRRRDSVRRGERHGGRVRNFDFFSFFFL